MSPISVYAGKNSLLSLSVPGTESCEAEKYPSKREVSVAHNFKKFGAGFVLHQDRLFVAWVDKYYSSTYSTAYKAGLGFGDEITSINGILAKEFRGDVTEVYAALNSSRTLSLELIEKTSFTEHTLALYADDSDGETSSTSRPKKKRLIGLSFIEDGTIARVEPGSMAALAGLRPGQRIISIGNRHTVGTTARDLLKIIGDSQNCSKTLEVLIVAAPGKLVNRLRSSSQALLSEKGLKMDLNAILDNDFNVNSFVGPRLSNSPSNTFRGKKSKSCNNLSSMLLGTDS
ncbi:hypothetical protein SARC_07438 [Sphaeroforma arctica JP610]|uniref:PDZ domain-containing protein n=1 Tax=Sphaeroforma arctica JP610 TaxID=667725 RepID=A0A0L0FTP9_9EUKA|nr:hypothetical protein SARC_07438 [Sphaeroforma arctica JP610]KNC80195.1 hypothetical protein SARC_07438 [Sphaeroforma arctica JP610]|eukprot:XP_014154097.1 hypothetical protein SARC_07438 [Sphaeroforma arctica JP610]